MSTDYPSLPSLEELTARIYRDKLGQAIRGYVGYLNLRPMLVCKGEGEFDDGVFDLLDNAEARDIISQQELNEVWGIHTIIKGENRQDGSVAYAAVDIAVIVEEHHINKAAVRAEILHRATGEAIIPAIVGAFINDDSLRQLAQERGVTFIHRGLDDAKMYRYIREDVLEGIYGSKLKL